MNKVDLLQEINISIRLKKDDILLFITLLSVVKLSGIDNLRDLIINQYLRKNWTKIEKKVVNLSYGKLLKLKFELPEAVAIYQLILSNTKLAYPFDWIKNELHRQITNYMPSSNPFIPLNQENDKFKIDIQ